jgi:hypothetical protein
MVVLVSGAIVRATTSHPRRNPRDALFSHLAETWYRFGCIGSLDPKHDRVEPYGRQHNEEKQRKQPWPRPECTKSK